MKALYCIATSSFFKNVNAGFIFPDRELEHLAMGEWVSVDLADGFDGALSHYTLTGDKMVLIPESEWPENQIEEEAI